MATIERQIEMGTALWVIQEAIMKMNTFVCCFFIYMFNHMQ